MLTLWMIQNLWKKTSISLEVNTEHPGPVTGRHHRDDEDRQIGTENVDDLLRTYRLERITWLIRGDRGHGRVAGLVFGAYGTGSGVIDEFNAEIGPVECGGGPLKHGSGSLTATVEVVHDTFPERSGDGRAAIKHFDRSNCGDACGGRTP